MTIQEALFSTGGILIAPAFISAVIVVCYAGERRQPLWPKISSAALAATSTALFIIGFWIGVK